MKITEIAFTVIPVTSLKKAKTFYEGVLGLKATKNYETGDTGFVEYDIGTATLAIGAGAGIFHPSKEGTVIALEVENFDEAVADLKKAGLTFKLDPQETPVCRMLVVADPDGNSVLIHKRK